MKIDPEDIAGYRTGFQGQTLLCTECFSKEEEKEEDTEVTSDMILSFDEVETDNDDYFCDQCKKKLER